MHCSTLDPVHACVHLSPGLQSFARGTEDRHRPVPLRRVLPLPALSSSDPSQCRDSAASLAKAPLLDRWGGEDLPRSLPGFGIVGGILTFQTPATPNRPDTACASGLWHPEKQDLGLGLLDVEFHEMVDAQAAAWVAAKQLRRCQEPPCLACRILFGPGLVRGYERSVPPPTDSIALPPVFDRYLLDVPVAGRTMAKPERDHATMIEHGPWRQAVRPHLASVNFANASLGKTGTR